ncbi:hypothetical protein [Haloflavibacter putidus]|nr:hypothetical protein [Haloflavibacter putidus]
MFSVKNRRFYADEKQREQQEDCIGRISFGGNPSKANNNWDIG